MARIVGDKIVKLPVNPGKGSFVSIRKAANEQSPVSMTYENAETYANPQKAQMSEPTLIERIVHALAKQIAAERDNLVNNPTDAAAGHIRGMMDAAKIIQTEYDRSRAGSRPDFEKPTLSSQGY